MPSRISASTRDFIWIAALGAVILALLVGFLLKLSGSAVSFDGAMNLQVAAALAERGEYARFYDTWRLFPREIQTNAPYLLPAALSFAIFGVNLASAQLVSIAYVVALIIVVYWLIRPLAGTAPALAAIALVLIAPELHRFGANGYGEIPGLFWFLLGLGCCARNIQNQAADYLVLGGLALGLSVLTKTVMLMPVGITVALFGLLMAQQREWRGLVVFSVMFALPIAAFEIWRVVAIGGLVDWLAWWDDQLSSILAQAGVQERFEDTPGWSTKLSDHATILARKLSLPIWLLPTLGIIPVGLIAMAMTESRRTPSSRSRAFILMALFATICAYFIWWLLITPTEKAWHRRIFNGLTLLAVAGPLVAHISLEKWQHHRVMVALSCLPLVVLIYSGILELRVPNPEQGRLESIQRGVAFARSAPASARFYGAGWYSAPEVSLLSGVRIYDLAARRHFLSAT